MPKSELPTLLRSILDRFSSHRALGDAIGITGSRVGRVLKGKDQLSTWNCLRLAAASGESPSRILRAANKGDVADLIEKLYGDAAKAIPERERRTVAQLHGLTTADRQAVQHLIDRLSARQPRGGRGRA